MVEHHGSQCGFCTPGFVMALYALWMERPRAERGEVEVALQGNLCRCTGYAPIVRAAVAVSRYGSPAADHLMRERAANAARLAALRDGARVEVARGPTGRSCRPTSTTSPRCSRPSPGRRWSPARPTSASGSPSSCARSPRRSSSGISTAARDRGRAERSRSAPARAIPTRAGAGGGLPASRRLLAPDRRLAGAQHGHGRRQHRQRLADRRHAAGADRARRHGHAAPRRRRRTLPLEDFFIAYGKQDRAPGEFVESVTVPRPAPGSLHAAYKISKRRDEDISSVAAGFAVAVEAGTVTAARIAFGGMAATPKRAAHAEAALVGRPWAEASLVAAAEELARDFTPLSDWRASAEYRMLVAKNLFRRFWLENAGAAAQAA
jgi:xanthine dehydrogenase small subunit